MNEHHRSGDVVVWLLRCARCSCHSYELHTFLSCHLLLPRFLACVGFCFVVCFPKSQLIPAPVKAIDDNVVSVALGSDHGAAVTEDGRLYTWGSSAFGQVSRPRREPSRPPCPSMFLLA